VKDRAFSGVTAPYKDIDAFVRPPFKMFDAPVTKYVEAFYRGMVCHCRFAPCSFGTYVLRRDGQSRATRLHSFFKTRFCNAAR
jgi:hypothetical protein